MQLYISDQ